MAIYWLTEAVPLAITALLPVVLFPLLGILDSGHTVQAYMKEATMILLGCLIAAAAVEVSGLHQRIALKVLRIFGTSPKWLLLVFMLNTMLLSMWISNTATTALMMPIVGAVVVQLRQRTRSVAETTGRRVSVISASDGPESGRPSCYAMRSLNATSSTLSPDDALVDEAAFSKIKTAFYLGICYSANIGGTGTLTGTTTNLILVGLLHRYRFIEDSVPAIFVAILFFMIPRHPMSLSKSPPLMTWKMVQEKVSWNVILLLGGSFALSDGAKTSGLSKLLGDSLTKMLSGMSSFTVQLVTSLIALFMTEVASNSTTATILCSVVGDVALSMGIAPLKLMLPVALSCSYAFMLPVSSPPNAIIFEAAEMKIKDMVLPGLAMKVICLIVTLISVNTLGGMVFDFSPDMIFKMPSDILTPFNATNYEWQ
ncbi:Solute carrier family 13 member 2 [Halotydeus destructor]|nr:Solute carrier family 13 member 2 [Halotydeus destructor]